MYGQRRYAQVRYAENVFAVVLICGARIIAGDRAFTQVVIGDRAFTQLVSGARVVFTITILDRLLDDC